MFFSSARNYIHKLEGIDSSESVQNQKLQNLKEQLELKKQLIHKYKNLDMKLSGHQEAQINHD